MSGVKTIETVYNGTKYRSRTEARWAVLFDEAEVDFQYEPEAFQLKSGCYVPDFWIEPWGCFFEVKADDIVIRTGYYCDERSKAEDLTAMTNKDVLFGCGGPHPLRVLNRVPVLGLSPIDEWLTDYVPAHFIPAAMKFRFDWAKPATSGRIGHWEIAGLPAWRGMHEINRNRKRDDDD